MINRQHCNQYLETIYNRDEKSEGLITVGIFVNLWQSLGIFGNSESLGQDFFKRLTPRKNHLAHSSGKLNCRSEEVYNLMIKDSI